MTIRTSRAASLQLKILPMPSCFIHLAVYSNSKYLNVTFCLVRDSLPCCKTENGQDKKSEMIVFPLFSSILSKLFIRRKFPQLLVTKNRTKNVSAKKKNLLVGPSDRIGANYTPSAKHLILKTIRKRRKRSVSRMPHIARSVCYCLYC